MKENQSDSGLKPSKAITRRAFLPWLIVGVSGLNASLVSAWGRRYLSKPLPKKTGVAPRFRKSGKNLGTAPTLTEGFYLNPKSQVIHYLPEGKKPRFTGKLNANRLQPKDPTEVAIESLNTGASTFEIAQPAVSISPVEKNAISKTAISRSGTAAPAGPPRVNVARASYSFEQAAVSQIKQNNVERGCDLLLYAIQYELRYRAAKPFLRSHAPSLRLYDLLAGISVRYNKPDYLGRLISLTESVEAPIAVKGFAQRLTKWRDPQSRWYGRWADKSKRIEWKVDHLNGLVF